MGAPICFYKTKQDWSRTASKIPALSIFVPLRAKRVREVANLTERKNRHTPVYGVKEFVRLSVINFDPNYLGTGKTEWAEIFFDIFVKMNGLKNFYLSEKCQ